MIPNKSPDGLVPSGLWLLAGEGHGSRPSAPIIQNLLGKVGLPQFYDEPEKQEEAKRKDTYEEEIEGKRHPPSV